MLLPPRKLPGWLNEVAAAAGRELTAVETADDGRTKTPAPSAAPAVEETR